MSGKGRPRRLGALFPAGTGTAARTPFVLLIVLLLGTGLIILLLLNSALNQGSFELSKLEKKTDDLTDEQQALQQEVDGYSAPDALEKRARRMGMVPGGNPAFLMPDGTVRGKPSVATGEEPAALSAPAEPPPAGLAAPADRPPAGLTLPSPSPAPSREPGRATGTPAPTTPGR